MAVYVALPMALLMIAAAWSIMAFGDTMWVRHRGQESADAAALASAISHAQALNLIAMMNTGMLAMTVVYLVARVLVDVMNLTLGVGNRPTDFSGREDLRWDRFGLVGSVQSFTDLSVGFPVKDTLNPLSAIGEVPLVGGFANAFQQPYAHDRKPLKSCEAKQAGATLVGAGALQFCEVARPVASMFWFLTGSRELDLSRSGVLPQYEKLVLGQALQGLNGLSRVLVKATPAAGLLQATVLGSRFEEKDPKHKVHMTALSSSMLPAKTWEDDAESSAGLPLQFAHARRLCDKSAIEFGITLQRAMAAAPGLSGAAKGPVGNGLKKVGTWMGNEAASRYCEDRFLRYATGPVGGAKLKI